MRRGSSYCALLPFRNLTLQKDKPDISGNQQIRLTSRLQYMTAWHLPVYMTTESVHCFTNKKERTYRISLESMPQSVGLCRFLRTAYTTIGVAKLLSMTFEHSDGPSDLRSNSKIELRDLLFISTFHTASSLRAPTYMWANGSSLFPAIVKFLEKLVVWVRGPCGQIWGEKTNQRLTKKPWKSARQEEQDGAFVLCFKALIVRLSNE